MIAKAGRKASHQIDRSIGRAKKQRAGIRRHQPRIKSRHHSAAFHRSKIKQLALHSVGIGALLDIAKSLSQKNFRRFGPDALSCEISGLASLQVGIALQSAISCWTRACTQTRRSDVRGIHNSFSQSALAG